MKTILLVLFISISSYAEMTKVFSIEKNDNNYEVLITSNGEVVRTKDTNIVKKLKSAQINNNIVKIIYHSPFDRENRDLRIIKEVQVIPSHLKIDTITNEKLNPLMDFKATNLESIEQASHIFNTLNDNTKRFSQCFNRAHVWAKQMHDQFDVKSLKILIYYTRKYRREVSKKWWFHIAPVVKIQEELYVMDRSFTNSPITTQEWEELFTYKIGDPAYNCKKIENISSFYNKSNTNSEYCNIQLTSMYYWEPNDMEKLEETGHQKTNWVQWELRVASKEAFKKWKKVYSKIKNIHFE